MYFSVMVSCCSGVKPERITMPLLLRLVIRSSAIASRGFMRILAKIRSKGVLLVISGQLKPLAVAQMM